jgi:broad specificity phosphatase PhoE
MTLLLLARHGETDWNAAGRFQGHADRPLSDRGREQARKLAARVADVPLAAIASSDLRRARDTAGIVAEPHGLEVVVEPALREVDVGSFSGLTSVEAAARFPDAYRRWRETAEIPWSGGETYEQMADRAIPAALRLAEELADDDRPLLLVAHGGTLRALLAASAGLDMGTVRKRHRIVPNACLMSVRAEAGRLHDFRADVDAADVVAALAHQ